MSQAKDETGGKVKEVFARFSYNDNMPGGSGNATVTYSSGGAPIATFVGVTPTVPPNGPHQHGLPGAADTVEVVVGAGPNQYHAMARVPFPKLPEVVYTIAPTPAGPATILTWL